MNATKPQLLACSKTREAAICCADALNQHARYLGLEGAEFYCDQIAGHAGVTGHWWIWCRPPEGINLLQVADVVYVATKVATGFLLAMSSLRK